jgi:hypothetical protein
MQVNKVTLQTIQDAIYRARWVEAYGKNSNLATDEEIAKAVYHDLFEVTIESN